MEVIEELSFRFPRFANWGKIVPDSPVRGPGKYCPQFLDFASWGKIVPNSSCWERNHWTIKSESLKQFEFNGRGGIGRSETRVHDKVASAPYRLCICSGFLKGARIGEPKALGDGL